MMYYFFAGFFSGMFLGILSLIWFFRWALNNSNFSIDQLVEDEDDYESDEYNNTIVK